MTKYDWKLIAAWLGFLLGFCLAWPWIIVAIIHYFDWVGDLAGLPR